MSDSAVELDFDPDALREKYREERDKRLRVDGNQQYREVEGELRRFVEDPYVEPGFTREAIAEELEILIIGGGFGGLVAAARLSEAGFTDLRIVEKGGDFGGTWYWNRYPGVQCDIESYIYLPLLEEVGYVPKEKYSFGPEILQHASNIGEKYNLYNRALFQTQINDIRWVPETERWLVSTDRGDALSARFVVMSNGPLNRPKLPAIPGIENFKGHTFHTSRWDYDYTGGDTTGGLDKLGDVRVGVIGTGATAIQCVPHLGQTAKHLYVFQRTPSSVDVRGNKQTDPEWEAALKPGWQLARRDNFAQIVGGGQAEEDMVSDGWTDIIRNLATIVPTANSSDLDSEETAKLMEIADFQKMNQVRARVDSVVEDPETAEALKPYYRQFCKRPTFNDDYLPTFNRPQRDAGRHAGPGCGACDRARGGRGWRSLRGGLPDLCYGVRGRYRIHAAVRVRGLRAGRSSVDRPLGRRYAHLPRVLCARLPELFSHGHHAERSVGQLHVHAGRPSETHRLRGQASDGAAGELHRTHR